MYLESIMEHEREQVRKGLSNWHILTLQNLPLLFSPHSLFLCSVPLGGGSISEVKPLVLYEKYPSIHSTWLFSFYSSPHPHSLMPRGWDSGHPAEPTNCSSSKTPRFWTCHESKWLRLTFSTKKYPFLHQPNSVPWLVYWYHTVQTRIKAIPSIPRETTPQKQSPKLSLIYNC